MRNVLVAALAACADRPRQAKTRRYLLGLSSDELQFIAEYLGACILDSSAVTAPERRAMFGPAGSRADRELKIILLREYLHRAGVQDIPAAFCAPQSVN